jgi:hypothetical protein
MWLTSSDQPPENSSPALLRFLKSMQIGFIEWHDGIGYDLAALKELDPQEINTIESLLISRKDEDWRDVEALADLATPAAIQALIDCLSSYNNEVKLFAVRYLKELNIVDRVEEVVVETLPHTKIGDGLTYALSLAKTYPSEGIKRAVLACCLNGNNDIRIHCAAMVLYLYGKAESDFDNTNQIIFEFREPDRAKRIEPFKKLCKTIEVDPQDFITC